MAEGFGYADDETETEIDENTVFRYGSVTKLFTALAVMQLVESGQIDLNAPLQRYIPEFSIVAPDDYSDIAVRDVLSHHGGLPGDLLNGWASGETDAPGWEAQYREYPRLLEGVHATMPPRTAFSYSNIGYSLLGLLVERVSGMSYASYVEENIFGRIGMDSSGFYLEEAFSDRVATGYLLRRSAFGDLTQIRDIPAGSVYASLADMGRFMEMLVAEGRSPGLAAATVLGEQAFAEMGRRQNSDVELDFGFSIGLCFWLFDLGIPDIHLMSHSGNIPPYNAFLITDPAEDLAVLTVTNAMAGSETVLELGNRLTRALVEHHRGTALSAEVLHQRPEVPLDDEVAEKLAGTWTGPMGLIDIRPRRGRLRVDLGPATVTAIHRGDGLLSVEFRLLGFTLAHLDYASFILRESGDEYYFETLYYGMSIGLATKCDPAPLSEVWRQRIGEYEPVDPGAPVMMSGVELRYDERRALLLAVILDQYGQDSMVLPLEIVSDTIAVTAGVGRNAGEVVEVVIVDGEERLFLSGFQARRVQ